MAQTIGPLRRERLHRAIQERVTQFIIERGYQPGDPLPSEAELARALGVSRPSLREAMRALQTLGVVEIRHGAGTFVGRLTLEPLTDGLTFQIRIDLRRNGGSTRALRELLDVRETLEGALVARVAGTLPPPQLAKLRRIVVRMEARAARDEHFPEEDWAFHAALYEALDNRLLLHILRAYWEVFDRVRRELAAPSDLPLTTAADHQRILQAVEAGDPIAATAAMTQHFGGIKRWIEHAQQRELTPAANGDPALADDSTKEGTGRRYGDGDGDASS